MPYKYNFKVYFSNGNTREIQAVDKQEARNLTGNDLPLGVYITRVEKIGLALREPQGAILLSSNYLKTKPRKGLFMQTPFKAKGRQEKYA